MIKLKNF